MEMIMRSRDHVTSRASLWAGRCPQAIELSIGAAAERPDHRNRLPLGARSNDRHNS